MLIRALVILACVVALPMPGRAVADGVDATVEVSGGDLSIATPTDADLGSGTPGGDVTAALGTVTVTDLRGLPSATWVATVTSGSFVTGSASAAETIPADAIDYWSGPATATEGVGTFEPGQLTSGDAEQMGSELVAFSENDGDGGGVASWDPTLIMHLPAAAVGGVYVGTILHSVV